jgi:transcriptional accessory protein Tex/SPT6
VGVELNSAGASLLRYVSGLNPAAAQEIVQYRQANGPYRSRSQLLQVPNLGESRFTQASAFLKVRDGDDSLDATWVHPESYTLARQLLAEAGFIDADLRDPDKLTKMKAKLAEVNVADAAARLGSTPAVVTDVIAALSDPYSDPRDNRTPPVLKRRMLRLEDLNPGMELKGTVVNVVPFGAFVDIGLKDTGLVHISRMANKFIKNPYEVVGVGDVVSVWVVEVDNERKRASLTMVAPGQERKPQPRPAFTAPPPRPPRTDRPAPPRPPRLAGPPPRPPQDRAARFQKPRPPAQPAGTEQGAAAGPPPAPPPPPKKPAKPKPLPKLSSEALSGKSPLGSFAELEAFFKTKDEPEPVKASEPPPIPATSPPPSSNDSAPPA